MDNPEVQKQFDDYFDLFSRPGWKLLVEDLEEIVKTLDSLDYVDSMEKLQYNKGQLEILKRLINMKNTMEIAYEEYQSERLDS